MKHTKEHIEGIKKSWSEVDDLESLCSLLNLAKDGLYGPYSNKPIQKKTIAYYSNTLIKKSRYKTFAVSKKSGGMRHIHAPHKGLKTIQRALNYVLQCVFKPHPAAHGFSLNSSIIDNARPHLGKTYVFNTDLKDFFPSCEFGRVKAVLKLPPFNLKDDMAFRITALCCTELEVERFDKDNWQWVKQKRSVLPQGAPTSPLLTNVICQRLDFLLSGLARRFGLVYTRYADDITFSSDHHVYSEGGEFRTELLRIIEDQGFYINDAKTRLQKKGYRQAVTGITVNSRLNTPRRYIKQIRTIIHNWEKSGYESANAIFTATYTADRGYINACPPLENVLSGKLDFLKMVRGREDGLYLKLADRFNTLMVEREKMIDDYDESMDLNYQGMNHVGEPVVVYSKAKRANRIELEDVLKTLLNEGIKHGMIKYDEYLKQ